MILTSASVALCVVILHLHKLGDLPVPVPNWLHTLHSKYIARLVGMHYIVKHRLKGSHHNRVAAESEEIKPLRIDCEDLNTRYKLIQIEGSGLYILAKDVDSSPMEKNDKEELNDLHKVKESGRVLRAMKAIMVENPQVMEEETHVFEKSKLLWHDIAEITDRLFFWLFFITIITSTVCLLVILPLSKPAFPGDDAESLL